MMTLTITLKPEEKDSHKMKTLDEIFAPFRNNLEASKISEEELDSIFTRARKEVFSEKQSHYNK